MTPPGRLEGLSGARKSGRFAPNLVTRRSKEERDASAPVIKTEPGSQPAPKLKQPSGSQGQGQWRRTRYQGTRAEAAGPLSAPSTQSAPSATKRRGQSTTGGLPSVDRAALRGIDVKRETANGSELMSSSIQTTIDLGDSSQTAPYFPVRSLSSTGETDLAADSIDAVELDEGNLYLFQIPDLGLDTRNFVSATVSRVKEEIKSEDQEDVMEVDEDHLPKNLSGFIGTLRHHASGKVTMVLNGQTFEVAPAAPSSSVESVLIVDSPNVAEPTAHEIGNVNAKYLIIPDVLGS